MSVTSTATKEAAWPLACTRGARRLQPKSPEESGKKSLKCLPAMQLGEGSPTLLHPLRQSTCAEICITWVPLASKLATRRMVHSWALNFGVKANQPPEALHWDIIPFRRPRNWIPRRLINLSILSCCFPGLKLPASPIPKIPCLNSLDQTTCEKLSGQCHRLSQLLSQTNGWEWDALNELKTDRAVHCVGANDWHICKHGWMRHDRWLFCNQAEYLSVLTEPKSLRTVQNL